MIILPIGAADPALIEFLSLTVGQAFGRDVRAGWAAMAPDFAYDPVRRQVHSTMLIDRIEAMPHAGDPKVLGVTEADLFIPIFTFVFGEARLGGRAAVMSVARLRESHYGRDDDPRVLYRRAEKEALHELGHTFGLVHCLDYGCVMHFANTVEDVDIKGDGFCAKCERRLATRLNPRRSPG
ncbi:MAG: archaemetzincin family Zn-dependent metalloprotease [Deltaproteobacteria bacterium]|nr:archaemetzincin family Zn-dependent metalloprotease [Deltaproteobacteria bacterium]